MSKPELLIFTTPTCFSAGGFYFSQLLNCSSKIRQKQDSSLIFFFLLSLIHQKVLPLGSTLKMYPSFTLPLSGSATTILVLTITSCPHGCQSLRTNFQTFLPTRYNPFTHSDLNALLKMYLRLCHSVNVM